MTEIQSHESFRNGNQTFDVGMDRLEVVNATRDLSPGERVRFWSTFQSSDEDTYPSVITGKTVDDVSAVLSGSKPATILELEDLEDPSIEELIAREQDRFGLLFVGETVDYYGRTKYFLGKSESVEALSELYRGRGGIESPLPVDEDFHRAVGEALGYSEDAIERFIKLVTNPKFEREQRRLAKKHFRN